MGILLQYSLWEKCQIMPFASITEFACEERLIRRSLPHSLLNYPPPATITKNNRTLINVDKRRFFRKTNLRANIIRVIYQTSRRFI